MTRNDLAMENPEMLAAISDKLAEEGWPDRFAGTDLIEAVLKAARAWEAANDAPRATPAPPRLVALEATDVPGLDPLKSIRLTVGPDKHAFVFTLSDKARHTMTQSRLENIAQVIGNLVHPAQATLVVVPDGCDLAAYEVEA